MPRSRSRRGSACSQISNASAETMQGTFRIDHSTRRNRAEAEVEAAVAGDLRADRVKIDIDTSDSHLASYHQTSHRSPPHHNKYAAYGVFDVRLIDKALA